VSDEFKVQLSLKDGNDMLNLRADTVDEFDALVSSASLSENPQLRRFFIERQKAPKAPSDTATAASAVRNATDGTTGSENPLCPECGGTTTEKETKTGKTYWACNQDRGECINDKGYPTSVWSRNAPKGRDS
jgi:hypothetical protein